MLKLIIEDDEGRKTVVPFVRDEITIGRQEGNTIRLTERNVSRRHARLQRANGDVLVEDLGSYNGIKLNGTRVGPKATVKGGDVIQIGDYELSLERDSTEVAPPPSPSHPRAEPAPSALCTTLPPDALSPEPEDSARDTLDSHAAAERPGATTAIIHVEELEPEAPRTVVEMPAHVCPRLLVLSRPLAGQEYVCVRTELTIGRDESNDICIDHRSLSRIHAKLVRGSAGEWRIVDQQSANGLLVNGEKYSEATLNGGDVVQLGHVKLRFVGAGEEPVLTLPGETRARKMIIGAAAVLVVGSAAAWLWWDQTAGLPRRAETAPLRPAAEPALAVRAPAPPAVVLEPARALRQPAEKTVVVERAAPPAPRQSEAARLHEDGLALMRNRQLREAKGQLEKCIKLDPTFAPCHKLLGAAYAKLNESEKGAFHYRKFLQLAPDDKDADRVRNILETYEHAKRP